MKNNITDYITKVNKERKEWYTYKKTISVSKCISYMHPEFNIPAKAAEMVRKYYDKEGHKYYHMSADEIIKLWDDKKHAALARGTLYDSLVEQVLEIRNPDKFTEWKLNHNFENDMFIQKAYTGLLNILTLFKNNHYICIGTEIPMYAHNRQNGEQIVNGRCDALFYNTETCRYLIIDWKTNEKIETTGFQTMYGPAIIYYDSDFYKYMFQLSFYKKALSETYNLAVSDNVDIMIAQMGRSEEGYTLYNPAYGNYVYDSNMMDNIIQYCYLKHNMKIS